MKGSLIGSSPWYQLFIVFLLAVAGTIVFLILGIALVPVFFPYSFHDIMEMLQSPGSRESVEIMKFLQGFNTLGTFLVPGLLGAYLLSKFPSEFLGVNGFPRRGLLITVLIVVLTLSGVSISDGLYRFSTQIEFPEFLEDVKDYLEQSEILMNEQISAFLQMDSFLDFMEVFVIMALLPAVCEETLFRGVVQPLFIRGARNVHVGILITSIIFGILHQQFYSFLSIVALSVVLGYLREWSKSLWVPVIMHLINNGTIIVAVYFFNMSLEDVNNGATGWDPLYFTGGIIVFALCLYTVYRLLNFRSNSIKN